MKKLLFLLAFLTTLFVAAPTFAHTVEKGDTMSEIARKNGLSLNQLAKANPHVKNIDLIYVGQQINTTINKTIHTSDKPSVKTLSNKTNNTTQVSRENDRSKKISLSEAEIDLLARIVRAEAQTESFEGKVAVASVVLNRVDSPKFPDTVREVIYQRNQFQPVANGQINKPADEESRKAVFAALSDMRAIAKDALFFYNPDIAQSRWLDSRETTVQIGQHVFKK
ncbi:MULTISPECIES: cell wall hydrolase [Bacillaceae]|uniref:cell wall hydrolase n=1 Tax=Bacillaceae TaxID=186817 RepID=UPI000BFBB311|nr:MULTISPECIES: cell wall hydrolase [Bacillaceae]PGT75017.1 N-acetylmuramoyl-L-alanine amidase [Bacillus sp. AFS040349]UGB32911.1 cell wall hydrolase [Metabacillus sp. B2-18]